MTRKKTKQEKGLFWTRKEYLEGSLPFAAYPTMEAAAQMAGKIVPFIPLDASDAGREALRERLAVKLDPSAFAADLTSPGPRGLEGASHERQCNHYKARKIFATQKAESLLIELGFPAPSKKGRK